MVHLVVTISFSYDPLLLGKVNPLNGHGKTREIYIAVTD
jgi:hypothetical protein